MVPKVAMARRQNAHPTILQHQSHLRGEEGDQQPETLAAWPRPHTSAGHLALDVLAPLPLQAGGMALLQQNIHEPPRHASQYLLQHGLASLPAECGALTCGCAVACKGTAAKRSKLTLSLAFFTTACASVTARLGKDPATVVLKRSLTATPLQPSLDSLQ
eukprot:CAMPEP_0172796576 /NCGR_PEP_ID=MMETSP1074-20121228/211054_1 /TAXON_ID=2916 /ORGANISM="Ceratium fusus, Strain PA161109" /LENGTH=159 /DNA_ID=CAMNT_0013633669 /DNA_START=131 /DNA_END=611 /DNA_ORIENTATION=-